MKRRAVALLVPVLSAVLAAAHAPAQADEDVIVLDVVPGPGPSYVQSPVAAGSVAWYTLYDSQSARLVRTDGRTASIVPGAAGAVWPVVRGSDLWCATSGPGPQNDLVRIIEDGTRVEVVTSKATGFGGLQIGPVLLGDHVLFFADGGPDGVEPWSADADTCVTTQLAATAQHPKAFLQGLGVAAGDKAVFWVYDPPLDWVPPSYPNPEPNDPSGGTLTMWVTDGTPEGTRALTSEPVPVYRYDMLGTVGSGGLVWFTRKDDDGAVTLWRTDGTVDGTFAVTAPDTGAGVSAFAEIAGKTAFLRWDSNGVQFIVQLMTTDGTSEGTAVVPGTPWLQYASPAGVAVAGSRLFLSFGDSVWSSDLTSQPRPVGGGVTAPPTGPSGLSVVDGRVLFVASDPEHGLAVWTSDGTPAGTRRLRDGLELEVPELGANFTTGFFPVGDRILFSAWDAAHGWEMRSIPRAWATDPLPPLEPDDTDPDAVVLPDVEPAGKVAGLRVRFLRRNDGDVLVVRGRVQLPRGTSLASERVIFGVGAYARAFALDKHGDAEDARGSFRSRKVRGRRAATFVAQIFDADARAALAGAGPTLRVGLWFDESLRVADVRRPR